MQSPPLAATVDVLADALVAELPAGADLVVPIANGEPVRLLDALEARADRLRDVRVHQMHTLRDRAYLHGEYAGRLEHVSWFLSPVTRPAYHAGTCEFAPANFSEVPQFLLAKRPHAVLAAASPMDRHGYFSLGVCADYAAAMIEVSGRISMPTSEPRATRRSTRSESKPLSGCTPRSMIIGRAPARAAM